MDGGGGLVLLILVVIKKVHVQGWDVALRPNWMLPGLNPEVSKENEGQLRKKGGGPS
jgi:hypothetical protein